MDQLRSFINAFETATGPENVRMLHDAGIWVDGSFKQAPASLRAAVVARITTVHEFQLRLHKVTPTTSEERRAYKLLLDSFVFQSQALRDFHAGLGASDLDVRLRAVQSAAAKMRHASQLDESARKLLGCDPRC